MDFAASAGAAAEDSALSREELQSRFNALKVTLNNIQETFSKGLREVEGILIKHAESLSEEFQNELKLKTKDIQSQVRTLFLQSPDASRVLQTNTLVSQLQREKAEWEQQKKQGYIMLESLKEQNRALESKLASMGVDMEAFNEERQKWEKEKTQGYSLMATYSEELAKAKSTTSDSTGDAATATPDTGVPLEDPEETIEELMRELDTSHESVKSLQNEVTKLTTENKQLWRELLATKDDLDERMTSLSVTAADTGSGGTVTQVQTAPMIDASGRPIMANGIIVDISNARDKIAASESLANAEMEISRLNGIIDVGRQKLLILTTENQRLTEDKNVLERLYKEAQFVIGANGYKSLYRSATKTNWETADLDALRKDMENQMRSMKDDELRKQFEAEEQKWKDQEELSAAPEMYGTGYVPDPASGLSRGDSTGSIPTRPASDTLTVMDPDNSYGQMVKTPEGGHLFRPMTKTDWDTEQLAKLKDELTSEMQAMHKKSLQALMDKQDALRYDEDDGAVMTAPISTAVPTEVDREELGTNRLRDTYGITEDQTDSEEQIQKLRDEMKAQLNEMNKQTLLEMSERQMQVPVKSAAEKLEEKSDSQMDLIKTEMVEALNAMTKQSLNDMFDKQMELRAETIDPTMPVVIDPSELASMDTEDRLRNLVRMQSTLGWSEEDLATMRADIESAMRSQQKAGLMEMMERQDAVRYPTGNDVTDFNPYDHPEFIKLKNNLEKSEDRVSEIEEEIGSLKSTVEGLTESLKSAELSKIVLAETTSAEINKLRSQICQVCAAGDGCC